MGLWTLSVLTHLELFSISANCRLVRPRTVCGICHWLFSPWNETSFEYSANILERLRSREQSNTSLNKIFPFPWISFACRCCKYNSCYFSTKFCRDKNEIEYSQQISLLSTIVHIKILRSVLCLCQSTSALRNENVCHGKWKQPHKTNSTKWDIWYFAFILSTFLSFFRSNKISHQAWKRACHSG